MDNIKRNSNHELLRIISMYMIVLIHANMYLPNFYKGDLLKFFNGAVNGICNIGVTCFILISGYYGVRFNLRKMIKLESMIISYSLLEFFVMYIIFPDKLQGGACLEQIIKTFFPVITRKYWFYSSYVCLLLLSGYINAFIEKLGKKELKKLLILLLILFSVFPTFFYFEIIQDNGKGLTQMIIIYVVGRYIRLYGDIEIPKIRTIVVFILLWGINGISHEVPLRVGGIYHHLCKDNSITNITMAVFLFYIFTGIEIYSLLINKIATYVFAVFALNNSLVFVIMHLFGDKVVRLNIGVLGYFLFLGIVLVILVCCIIIGVIREYTVAQMENNIINTLEEKVCKRFH